MSAPALSRPALITSALTVVVLVASSSGYGYHRDELYFLAAGHHLAWGYPDQPPLVPLLAWLADWLAPGSLVALRVPAALAGGLIVLFAALIAREMGAGRRGQFLAAACTAATGLVLVAGHLLVTASIDICFSAALAWLTARLLRTGDERLLLAIGVVLGIGLLDKSMLAAYAVALLLGLIIAGPRNLLRSRWLLFGALAAIVIVAPNLIWQAQHDWPQFRMAGVISGKGDQGGRLGFLPFQLLQISPLIAVVWISGLIRLFRSPAFRALGVAYVVLAVMFLIAGGKPYYLGGAYPALLAAGALVVDGWLDRGRQWLRAVAIGALITASAAVLMVVGLPIVPVDRLADTPVLALNGESGAQVAWPRFTEQVVGVYRQLSDAERARATIVARNYGEAGALQRFGPDLGLPAVYSGHNAFADWGRPPDSADIAVLIGSDSDGSPAPWARSECRDLREAATIDNGYRLKTEEQGRKIWVCRGLATPWSQLWPRIRTLS